MPRHPIELARKQYEGLPAVLKQALFSAEIAEQMFEIGKKFGLTIEKTGIMAEETGYIMLGITRPNELVGNLARELGVDSDKAQDIGAEISHKIFFPLREELKRTHDFDMGADEVVGSGGAARVSGPPERPVSSSRAGMPMPPNIKKVLVEEKSPLVSDLTRTQESPALPTPQKLSVPAVQPRPSFQPPVSPTGRIDDLQKMVEKSSLPQPAPELFASPSRKITDLKTTLQEKESGVKSPAVSAVGPWEKDLEKEVSSLLVRKPAPPPQPKGPLPIDLRPLQKPATVPPPPSISKLPLIDLRPTTPTPPAPPPPPPAPPSVPRMTPQMQDLVKQMPAQDINKSLAGNEIGPTLLEEKLRLGPQEKAAAPKITPSPTPSAVVVPAESGGGAVTSIPGGSDPYREPVEETNV